jgi:amino acid transporter
LIKISGLLLGGVCRRASKSGSDEHRPFKSRRHRPAARGTLAMGVYRALPTQFAKIHPKFKTPAVSTLFIGGIAIVLFVLLSLLGENAYGDVLLAIGLQISFYYGITAFACVWYFRKDIAQGGKDLWIKGILPLLD